MEKFTTLTSVGAVIRLQNIDTDMIIPKQFLKTIKRTGLSEGLFYEMRYSVDGQRQDGFVLHQPPYDAAQILLAGDNFGCGSSREHAPWALLDFGIKAVISTSFADIFFNNCFKNGILPVVLPQESVDELMQVAEEGLDITIDLQSQTVRAANKEFNFDIDPTRKNNLLKGLDDIGLTLEKSDRIDSFEAKDKELRPWI